MALWVLVGVSLLAAVGAIAFTFFRNDLLKDDVVA